MNEFTWCQLAVAAAQQQQQGAAAFSGGGGGGNLFASGGGGAFGDPSSRSFLGYNQFQGDGGGSAYSLFPPVGNSSSSSSSSSKPIPPSSSYFSSTKGNNGHGNNVFDSSVGSSHASSSTSSRLVSRERSTSAPNVCIHNTNILFSDSPNSALYPPSSGGSLGYGSASRRFVSNAVGVIILILFCFPR